MIFASPLLGQLVKNRSKRLTNLAVEHFATALRDEYHVILALPFRVI